jgi:hypothetical protein
VKKSVAAVLSESGSELLLADGILLKSRSRSFGSAVLGLSLFDEAGECLRARCDGGVEMDGASLCDRRDRPYTHSVPWRSHLEHVGLCWLQRTLDSLQELHDARRRIVFPSIVGQ